MKTDERQIALAMHMKLSAILIAIESKQNISLRHVPLLPMLENRGFIIYKKGKGGKQLIQATAKLRAFVKQPI